MKKNIGIIDKAVRILTALVIAALYFTQIISGALAMVLVLATVFIVTTFLNFCPIWWILGLSTRKKTN